MCRSSTEKCGPLTTVSFLKIRFCLGNLKVSSLKIVSLRYLEVTANVLESVSILRNRELRIMMVVVLPCGSFQQLPRQNIYKFIIFGSSGTCNSIFHE